MRPKRVIESYQTSLGLVLLSFVSLPMVNPILPLFLKQQTFKSYLPAKKLNITKTVRFMLV